ncbi:unnamed protein product [Colias eurytheme]|nr:unnamed protein product [Colias eurytheme]
MALYKLYIVFCYIAAASGQFVDEMQTFTMECLEENVFECVDGGCILQDRYCDGNYDCKDGSDENFCSNHTANAVYCNETHQFECADGKSCIPNSWVCNFDPDCEDGSDERNCTVTVIAPNATCKGFACDGNRCISTFWMCDGAYDCEDKTDEDIENTCRHALRPREMNSGVNCKIEIPGLYEMKEYACLDRSFCVPRDHMCDGIKDCKDGSDEGTFCQHWHTMCDNFPCNGTKCAPDRSGPYCDCQSAHYKYNYTTQHCESVNNCMDDVPWCSHQCVRAGDTFKCVCEPGYDMDFAGYLCYAPDPEAMLFYSTRNEIRYIKVKSKTESVVASGIKQAHGVTYDGNFVYWVETAQGHQAIVRAHLNNVLETKEVLVALGLEDPGDIAIDYLGGNIYFTDVERGVISVCKTDGSVCSVLHADTRRPRYVTVDPRNGKMFWADWMDRPLIMTSVMDGTHPEILVDVLGGYATGLALDAANDRLYFVDGTIRVVKLFDKNVYSLFEEPYHHPYTISIFENTVYWSEWTTKTIQTSDKMHSDKRAVLVSLDEPVFDMHIYHPLLTPQDAHNPCTHNGCSHICIPTSNSTYACVCPEGMALDGRVCAAIPEYRPQYLIVASGSLFTRIQYNMLGNPETHTTHFDIARVQAMAYDNFRDTLFLYDGQRKSINYINMSDFTLGVTRLFEYNALENVIDMGYDYVSDALYILDAGRRMIDVISLRTKQRTLIHRFSGQEIPVSFCIVPEYGRLLVALVESESNNEIYIDSMGLDGQDKMHILTNNILGPNIRLRYSPEMDIVYIADEGHGIIDYFHPEGTGRTHFREITTTIANLAVTDTHVFWTDRHTQRVYWADVHKHGHVVRRMELSIFPNTTFLHLQVTSPPPDLKNPLTKHACFQIPSPCSHICVQIPHPIPQDLDMGYKCMCPIGLVWDGEACVGLVECKLHESYCYKSNECYLMGKKCDGIRDCRYGEDEESCPPHITQSSHCGYGQKMCNNICIGKNDICKDNVATVTCSPMEVQCVNTSICIDKSSVCNGLSDCPEGTDETPAACSTIQCLDTEFTCTSSPCIPISWKCDGFDDCADGSDEINCSKLLIP